jgi:transcription elongation factor Elf1
MPMYKWVCPFCGHEKEDLKEVKELNNPVYCDNLIPLTDFIELPGSKKVMACGQECGAEMKIKIQKTSFKI